LKFFITHSQYYDIRKMNQFLIIKKNNNCCSFSHYIFWWGMNMMYKMQLIFFGLLILALEFQLPFHFQILQGKVIFIKVQINCQSLTNWVGLLYASGIGKSDLCCYCAAEGIQQDNDLKRKYWVVLPLCQACLRDKKPILKRNPIKNWQNMNLMLHNCF
jgi:hypothetical protein